MELKTSSRLMTTRVLVNNTALYHKHHTSYRGNVSKRIAIEGDDVGL